MRIFNFIWLEGTKSCTKPYLSMNLFLHAQYEWQFHISQWLLFCDHSILCNFLFPKTALFGKSCTKYRDLYNAGFCAIFCSLTRNILGEGLQKNTSLTAVWVTGVKKSCRNWNRSKSLWNVIKHKLCDKSCPIPIQTSIIKADRNADD